MVSATSADWPLRAASASRPWARQGLRAEIAGGEGEFFGDVFAHARRDADGAGFINVDLARIAHHVRRTNLGKTPAGALTDRAGSAANPRIFFRSGRAA
jgi:hypothetical protein